ncbi:hypothetical protein [Novosphingobium soli]|uniref:Uncharacterized protein n=1 Tax=Novosphingobium soli TaxID=574956 RepID=A0ABV6CSF8_9SPHN
MSKTDPSIPASNGTNIVALPAKTGEQRPSEKVIAFVKKHPVMTVAGGIAIGVAVSALLPRKASRRLLGKAVDLAEAAGAASAVFAHQAGDRAHDLGIDARKRASVFATKAEKVGDRALINLEKYGLAAVGAASALGRTTARRASRLSDAAADQANRLGDVAAVRSAKVLHMAEGLKSRVKS